MQFFLFTVIGLHPAGRFDQSDCSFFYSGILYKSAYYNDDESYACAWWISPNEVIIELLTDAQYNTLFALKLIVHGRLSVSTGESKGLQQKATTGGEEAIEDLAAGKEGAIEDLAAGKDGAIEDLAAGKEGAIENLAASEEGAIEDLAASEEKVIEDLAAGKEGDALQTFLCKRKQSVPLASSTTFVLLESLADKKSKKSNAAPKVS